MRDALNIDFSNISNNISGVNKPINLSTKLVKALRQVSESLNESKRKSVVKLEVNGENFELPSEFGPILIELANKAANRSQIHIVGSRDTFTTQQAADYLGYSRPTLIKMLDEYKIPITLVGKHRKIEFTELIRLENQIKAERKKFLEDMAKEDYELGKLEGFDPVKNARR